jgi:nitroreductase
MDTFLTIVSKRDTRRYLGRPIAPEVVERIFEAGRLAGSARNRQPWRLLLVERANRREELANAVYAPGNIRGAQLVIAIVGSSGLDVGRCMQNVMLAAWNDGVVSCPNGIADAGLARTALGLAEGRHDPGRAHLRLPGERPNRGEAEQRWMVPKRIPLVKPYGPECPCSSHFQGRHQGHHWGSIRRHCADSGSTRGWSGGRWYVSGVGPRLGSTCRARRGRGGVDGAQNGTL